MNKKTGSKFIIGKTKKARVLFYTGLVLFSIGFIVVGLFVCRTIYRNVQKEKLFRENPVIEIPIIEIKAPILEGTDQKTLARAVGHFYNTGAIGSGNYCIAGHSSTIYKEYFNGLADIKAGDDIYLYDKSKKKYHYKVESIKIVEPNDTWILRDYGDNRITLVTCTDDGSQRIVVVGMLYNS